MKLMSKIISLMDLYNYLTGRREKSKLQKVDVLISPFTNPNTVLVENKRLDCKPQSTAVRLHIGQIASINLFLGV